MRVFILCPAATISGGPEALHQLCAALRAKGVDAAMVYYPAQCPVPEPYRHYGVAVSPGVVDVPESVVVIPEVVTSIALRFPNARKAVWWLSVDNYFKWLHRNPGPSVFEPRPDLLHLCQSQYAHDFLAGRGVGPLLMLTDYLTTDVFVPRPLSGRLPLVAYNPKKAPETTQALISRDARQIWMPLENLSKSALADLLGEVRLYVDFGPHPGRDRIPREAALCGAVVITGRRGAAGLAADVPLPDRFRLDERRSEFEAEATSLIAEMLHGEAAFLAAAEEQAGYRNWIGRNHQVFLAQVDDFIATMSVHPAGGWAV